MTIVLCYLAGVLLATGLRFLRWKVEEGQGCPLGDYWKRAAWQSASSALLAIVLLFLWADGIILGIVNAWKPAEWAPLQLTNLASIAAGFALDWGGEYLVRIFAVFVRKKLPVQDVAP